MARASGDVQPGVAGDETGGGVALRGAGDEGPAERDGSSGTDDRRERPSGVKGGVTETRVAAANICAELRARNLLDHAFEKYTARLDARDRRWTRELVYGMLRRRAMLDAILNQRIRGGYARLDADLLDLLRLGSYQLLHMTSVPPYAAIAQTVELAKRRHGIGASKLSNAVLRRLDRESAVLELPRAKDPVDSLALEFSHPRWLVKRWVERLGADETRLLLESNNREAPLILRPVHVVREQLEAMLESAGVQVQDAPLVRDSIQIAGAASSITELGAFRGGHFHVQDPASTLVTEYASFPPGVVAADLCAAPGGKAIEIARTASRVYACDVSPLRIQRLAENVLRLELTNVYAIVADAMRAAIRPVDAVLVDAPCTGTGTFRRHPDARWRLQPSDLPLLCGIQRQILRSAATLVAPGGLLVYSTCSIEPEENDAQVDAFLRTHPNWTLEPPPEGTVPAAVVDGDRLRVVPHRHGTDGSFAARLRRAR